MYDLPYFKENDREKVLEFIQQHPFATVIGNAEDNFPVATQVPVFIEEHGGKLFLSGHIMKQTGHHKAFVKNQNVLVLFTGPHTYVSATWYTDPHQASTWNYMSIHARGKISFGSDADLEEMLRKTTLHFEGHNKSSTTIFDNLSREYTESLMKAIVAFKIEVVDLQNVFKLSQNRDEESYGNIISELESQGGDAALIAEEMKKRKDVLFNPKQNDA